MLIAIEGLIGVGKSTVQKLMSECYTSTLLVQDFEHHPYLMKYYEDPNRYAIEKDMIFLFMGYHQLCHLNHEGQLIISDFTFEKSDIFARAFLPTDVYQQLFRPPYLYLRQLLDKPDLILYLAGSPKLAMRQIKQRGRSMEEGIAEEALVVLHSTYDEVLLNLTETTVLVDDNTQKNFLANPEDLDLLLQQLEDHIPDVARFRRT